jgi:hypothetical protein
MSAHALVTISQRFEHIEYLRYLVGLFGAALAEIFFLGQYLLRLRINNTSGRYISKGLPKIQQGVGSLRYHRGDTARTFLRTPVATIYDQDAVRRSGELHEGNHLMYPHSVV